MPAVKDVEIAIAELLLGDNITSPPLFATIFPPAGILWYLFSCKNLEEYIQRKTAIFDIIRDVVSFETWWNKNVGTVISGNCPYTLWLVVYEPKQRIISSEIIKKFEINNGYDRHSLESAKSKADSLRVELNGENPILLY